MESNIFLVGFARVSRVSIQELEFEFFSCTVRKLLKKDIGGNYVFLFLNPLTAHDNQRLEHIRIPANNQVHSGEYSSYVKGNFDIVFTRWWSVQLRQIVSRKSFELGACRKYYHVFILLCYKLFFLYVFIFTSSLYPPKI